MEKISVVIPTYNRAQLLRRAIRTVIEATCLDDEIIVVDDGSTDETSSVPAEFNREIRYILLRNRGAGAARNAGVKGASHDLIAFVDSDDEWLPERLDQQRPLMGTRRDLIFSFTDFGQLFPDGHIEHSWAVRWHGDTRPWDEILAPGQLCSTLTSLPKGVPDVQVHIGSMYYRQLGVNYINVNTALIRRSLAGDALHFGEDIPTWEDAECFARLTRLGQCAYLNIDTALQRTHPGPRLSDADAIRITTAQLTIINRTWATDEVFVHDHGKEMNELIQNKLKLLTKAYIVNHQFDQARIEAAKLEHGFLERTFLSLPSDLSNKLLELYIAFKKYCGPFR